ncbi:MAG: SPOR domain-containing protein [Phycisphaerales bacterium]|jgi:tetratricopeptide (TPR) repeat protein|nr:SPOR domain-containing protein [Phycisphaerales bacterium]
MEKALLEYDQGQWSISEMWAKKALNESESSDEAAYLIGLCEFRMQRIEKSKQWFTQASESSNEEVRGKSNAMLGIIASSTGDYVTAARAFEEASADLSGSDRAKASSHAIATSSGNSFSSSTIAGSYTLQFGAYQSLENAKNAANKLGSQLRLAGIGNVSIFEEKSKMGTALFVVQAGSFDTRAAAAKCRNLHTLPQCIVTAVQ